MLFRSLEWVCCVCACAWQAKVKKLKDLKIKHEQLIEGQQKRIRKLCERIDLIASSISDQQVATDLRLHRDEQDAASASTATSTATSTSCSSSSSSGSSHDRAELEGETTATSANGEPMISMRLYELLEAELVQVKQALQAHDSVVAKKDAKISVRHLQE